MVWFALVLGSSLRLRCLTCQADDLKCPADAQEDIRKRLQKAGFFTVEKLCGINKWTHTCKHTDRSQGLQFWSAVWLGVASLLHLLPYLLKTDCGLNQRSPNVYEMVTSDCSGGLIKLQNPSLRIWFTKSRVIRRSLHFSNLYSLPTPL